MTVTAPPPPRARLSLGLTGHRATNAAFTAHRDAIAATLEEVLDLIARAAGEAPVRFHSLLADGADQLAARSALARGWELVAPLPFGRNLNVAINAGPTTLDDARALAEGRDAADPAVQARATAIHEVSAAARRFELAERDPLVSKLFFASMAASADIVAAQAFAARSSAQVALAGRVLVEQSDIVIGVWDGVSRAFVGGTGHTICEALEHGAPVVWIDAAKPADWRILRAPEALAVLRGVSTSGRETELAALVRDVLRPADERESAAALGAERWRPGSNHWWTGYRRIEALFDGGGRPFRSLDQTYKTPDALVAGSGHPMLAAAAALPGADAAFAGEVERRVLRRFAWADGIAARLSDAYRGGMVANFLLSAAAVVVGVIYQPLGASSDKWMFAIVEFLLLAAILLITAVGGRLRWHGRWFETRRVAEYLRHAPILLLLGVARAPGRWPKGAEVSWPEYHARHALRETGLPRVALTPAYLRSALANLLDVHVCDQRDYHIDKANRLTAVHRNLDRFSTRLFQAAVISVATYLALEGAAALGLIPQGWPYATSYFFTFLGVALPTFGAAIAGIRYFGDFERFAAISEVTAAKLGGVHSRIALLLDAPDDHLDYARVSELVHATDDVVVSEIENWQAVFGGKHITVPV